MARITYFPLYFQDLRVSNTWLALKKCWFNQSIKIVKHAFNFQKSDHLLCVWQVCIWRREYHPFVEKVKTDSCIVYCDSCIVKTDSLSPGPVPGDKGCWKGDGWKMSSYFKKTPSWRVKIILQRKRSIPKYSEFLQSLMIAWGH